MFNKELEVSKYISGGHPSIVKFAGASELTHVQIGDIRMNFDQAVGSILYEFCAGGDLFDFVSNKVSVMRSGVCRRMFAQVCQGISYMH